MGVPSNAMWFRWQGRDSRDYGLVLTDLPHIITPSRNVEEVFVSNASKMPMLYNGYNPYDIQLSIAYIGTTVNNTEVYWDEHTFIEKMGEFFYQNASYIQTLVDKDRVTKKLVLSTQLPYYIQADIVTNLDFVNMYKYRATTVQFHCQPFRRKLAADSLDPSIYTNNDIYVSGTIYSPNGSGQSSTLKNTQHPADKCFAINRRPKFTLEFDSNYTTSIDNFKYIRVLYMCPVSSSSIALMEPYKKYIFGRQYIIDYQKVCNKISSVFASSEYGLVIEIDTDNDNYMADYAYTYEEQSHAGSINISDCINNQINYGGALGIPKDWVYETGNIYTPWDDLKQEDYNVNRRLSVGNSGSTAQYAEYIQMLIYTSAGTVITDLSKQVRAKAKLYPLMNII